MKVEKITLEYRHCGECPHLRDWFDTGKAGYRCSKKRRIIPDLWGDIPDWCPLETKKEEGEC